MYGMVKRIKILFAHKVIWYAFPDFSADSINSAKKINQEMKLHKS